MCEGTFDCLHAELETNYSGESEWSILPVIPEYLVRFGNYNFVTVVPNYSITKW